MAAQVSPQKGGGLKVVFGKMTMSLFVACLVTSIINVLYGWDTTSFGGVQSIPAFEDQFGTPIGPNGSYVLSASRASFMSSVAFAGKLTGSMVRLSHPIFCVGTELTGFREQTAPFVIERVGHRYCIFLLCLISLVGISIECTAHTVAQFVIGRIIVYHRFVSACIFEKICSTDVVDSVGLAENVSTYVSILWISETEN
jgi:hypothetical protein